MCVENNVQKRCRGGKPVYILKNIEAIGIVNFTSGDVVRHPLVQSIVEAYDKYEK